MSVVLNNKEIPNLYVGSTMPHSVYLGNKLVYPEMPTFNWTFVKFNTNYYFRGLADYTTLYTLGNNSHNLFYSSNGTSWSYYTDCFSISADWVDITHRGTELLAVAGNGACVHGSPGYTNWQSSPIPNISVHWNSISNCSSSILVLGGTTSAKTNKAALSWNGSQWVDPVTLPATGVWEKAAGRNGKWVAVGHDFTDGLAHAAYSTNLTAWTDIILPRVAKWSSIACSQNGLFVAVADDGGRAVYSPDGLTWYESATANVPGTRVHNIYSKHLFLAVKSGTPGMISPDGNTWFELNLTSTLDGTQPFDMIIDNYNGVLAASTTQPYMAYAPMPDFRPYSQNTYIPIVTT